MGDSLVEEDVIDTAQELMEEGGERLRLPVDMVIANDFDPEAEIQTLPVGPVPVGWRILDVGPETISVFSGLLAGAGTVVWNGPMGVFEFPAFAQGTFELAKAVAGCGAKVIVGGGDSVAAIQQSGLANKITHISTGGGASLEMLKGKVLPGLEGLMDA